MVGFFVKDPSDATWEANGLPYVRTTSGWAKAKQAYRKSAVTTWTPFWTLDTTAPAPPVLATLTINAVGKLSISVTAPVLSDIREVMVKVGTAVSNNSMTDANFVSAPDGYDEHWSLWKMLSGQTRTKTWPVSGALAKGTTYHVTAWTIDWARNMSAPVSLSVQYVTSGTQVISKSGYVTTVDSATWDNVKKVWTRTNKNLNCAGPGWGHGVWFYSTKIATMLAKAKTITKMQVEIQRINTGLANGTNFKLLSHKMATWSSVNFTSPTQVTGMQNPGVGNLLKGQAKTYLVDTAWLTGGLMAFKSGTSKGLGLYAQATQDTASYYGYGTNSGRIYFEWTE